METRIDPDQVYIPSENIVVRLIEGELLIIPLTSDFIDFEDEVYSLNETGKALWAKLDPPRSLTAIINELKDEYNTDPLTITDDVLGLVNELLKKGILVEASD